MISSPADAIMAILHFGYKMPTSFFSFLLLPSGKAKDDGLWTETPRDKLFSVEINEDENSENTPSQWWYGTSEVLCFHPEKKLINQSQKNVALVWLSKTKKMYGAFR